MIDAAATGARVASLPRAPMLFMMKLCHHLGLSPLGPYHYGMISENFEFDTTRIKTELKWQPTLTNEEMLLKAYDFYIKNKAEIKSKVMDISAHKRPAKMGIIKFLKMFS